MSAKLTQSDANKIRMDFHNTHPKPLKITTYSNVIAYKYGVSTKTIRDILQHRTWIPQGGININEIEEKGVRASIRLMLLTDPFAMKWPPSNVEDEWTYADVCTYKPHITQLYHHTQDYDGIDDFITFDQTMDDFEEMDFFIHQHPSLIS